MNIKILRLILPLSAVFLLGLGGSEEIVKKSEEQCPVPVPSAFPQPETRCFFNDSDKTELEAAITKNSINGAEVITSTYEGGLFGPTLLVPRGGTIKLSLKNNLPENPENQRTGPTGAFPHNPYTTNFHTHGLSVTPKGISDNVLRLMEPGTDSPVEVFIPDIHACGTMWYHPHKHGSVSFQFFGGMAGFLIIKDSGCPLDNIPEIKAAKDILMGFDVIRVDKTNREVPFVNQDAVQFSSSSGESLWKFFRDESDFYMLTNGVSNPTLNLRPGEVVRLRLLNAASGETLVIGLEEHQLNVIAQDGLNFSEVTPVNDYVMGAGNRVDVMVKAGAAGTYQLQALDPTTARSISSIAGVDPAARNARIGTDFPTPTYPFTLATIEVSGEPVNMQLPSGPLPPPGGLPDIATMKSVTPAKTRNISFEICSPGTQGALNPALNNLCTFYFDQYDAAYWGGIEFKNLLMMRDADDVGPAFKKEGLFTAGAPLFVGDEAMVAGTFEEWTILNRTPSDHPFHIHQNPFLVTHINGVELTKPEWRDTILVPAASNTKDPVATAGSITYRTHLDPISVGDFVAHCHILTHEDVGMMQEMQIAPGPDVSQTLNATEFQTGDTMSVGVSVNHNVHQPTEFYMGGLLPDGNTLFFVTALDPITMAAGQLDDPRTFRPLVKPADVIPAGDKSYLPNLLPYTFIGIEPVGNYQVFTGLSRPDAFKDGNINHGDFISLDIKTVTFEGSVKQ